jgi:hypothetical protein
MQSSAMPNLRSRPQAAAVAAIRQAMRGEESGNGAPF